LEYLHLYCRPSVYLFIDDYASIEESGMHLVQSNMIQYDIYMYCSIVSSPGKVLLVGGYLILEKPNIGVTIAADSRFFAEVELEKFTPQLSNQLLEISVKSPQFFSSFSYVFDPLSNVLIEKRLLLLSSFMLRL
jgi:hypothetical protein